MLIVFISLSTECRFYENNIESHRKIADNSRMVNNITDSQMRATTACAVLLLPSINMKNTTKKTAAKKTSAKKASPFQAAEVSVITCIVASVDARQVKEKGKRDKVSKFAVTCVPLDGQATFTLWLESNQPCPMVGTQRMVLSKFVPSKYKAPSYTLIANA